MKKVSELILEFEAQQYRDVLKDIYVDKDKLDYQMDRYIKALEKYKNQFNDDEVSIYSAPGRSEIGGNHTDHQRGEVLAASINDDAIAIVSRNEEARVNIVSEGYKLFSISLNDLQRNENEKGTTKALVRGVLAAAEYRGYKLGGFNAYITSDVLIGAGLSSSAAFETIIGTIISGLYNDMKVSPIEIAVMGQYAENVYFGKPCGLMDQMACSVGNLVHIDFANPKEPIVDKVGFDFGTSGYSLCITDTKGSHADLTDDYAAVPAEMKKVANYFGREVLREVSKEELMNNLGEIREHAGDRAVLRAMHFVEENARVRKEVDALKKADINTFLYNVKSSGDSSFKYLQNVYTNKDIEHQNVSVALAASDMVLGDKGVSRVHGGGFAGTIQAFVENDYVNEYKYEMERIFGNDSCSVLKIRKYGGIKVI